AWGSKPVAPPPPPPIEQPFRFQGQQFDEETGLHYNRFRYYDPVVGRFVSQDPIGLFGGENIYKYSDNTNTWIDPLGLAPFKPCHCTCEKILDAMHPMGGNMVNIVLYRQIHIILYKMLLQFKYQGIVEARHQQFNLAENQPL
ncbi:RHS repeat-associated core domain-containing protein, partial [Delftia acidovorans]|uniref:RHS repeat-associated core domain-containing protein n=1 Tax=Delftia acidovorans TaxID=80866 RepID=UPI003019A81D